MDFPPNTINYHITFPKNMNYLHLSVFSQPSMSLINHGSIMVTNIKRPAYKLNSWRIRLNNNLSKTFLPSQLNSRENTPQFSHQNCTNTLVISENISTRSRIGMINYRTITLNLNQPISGGFQPTLIHE